ncbi:beta strand repeat-containing protein [Bdellovibrio sp. HCB274]|uniref:beta strand repeat-containing protein n=1 Tax=Bdellovibrio sp. HCB274 TaxID=3394361 RepID=UPI0039B5A492
MIRNVTAFIILILSGVSAFADQTWSSGPQSPGTYTGITTITGTTVTLAAGTYNFDTLIVNGTASALGNTGSNIGVTINATTVTITGSLHADTNGNLANAGTGRGYSGGGGSYGGLGGNGPSYSDSQAPYGTVLNPSGLGSGGGSYANAGGKGGGSITLNVTGTLTVNGNLSAKGGNGVAAGDGGGSGGTLNITTSVFTGNGTVSVSAGNGNGAGGGGGGGRASISYSTSNSYSGTYSAAGGASTIQAGTPGSFVVLDSVNNDLLIPTTASVTATEMTFRNITIASGATLNVSSMGAAAQSGTGAGNSQTGASYGGIGGTGGGSIPPNTYGSALVPVDVGSGGANYMRKGGNGGGAINLIATGTLQIDGSISANGANGFQSGDGGGSGGSVYLRSGNLAGAGSVTANGGNGSGAGSGSGGGGRISISFSGVNSFSGTIGSAGGTTGNVGRIGSALIINSATNSLFVISNSSLPTGEYTFTNVTINSGATLAADGLGSRPQTGTGGGGGTVGAGYGGYGGNYTSGALGQTYGTVVEPTELGSGGGSYMGMGGHGGGALKLNISGTLSLSGTISSGGFNGRSSGDGGGSGGSLWITVGTITGSGSLNAIGGNGAGSGGGGGGGRIYVKYTTNSFSGALNVNGGTGGSPAAGSGTALMVGSAGGLACMNPISVTIDAADFPTTAGDISISNGCTLTLSGDVQAGSISVTGVSASVKSNLIVKGNITATGDLSLSTYSVMKFLVTPVTYVGYTLQAANISIDATSSVNSDALGYPQNEGPGKASAWGGAGHGNIGGRHGNGSDGGPAYGTPIDPITVGSGGTIYNQAGGTGGGAIRMVATGAFTINGTITANATNGVNAGDGGGSGGSISLFAGSFAGAGQISAIGGNGGNTSSGGGSGGRIYLNYSSTNSYSGGFNGNGGTPTGLVGTILVVKSSTNDLFIPVSSSLDAGTYSFNNVTIASGATLNLDGMGYAATAGPGGGVAQMGGGYGGNGGYSQSTYGLTYGTAVNPTEKGSGGGNYTSGGGRGGGALKLNISGTFTINGALSTNGQAGVANGDGGGAGGSIWLDVGTITGAGTLAANGGNSTNGGAGGGGRIYVKYTTNSFTGAATASPGTGSAGLTPIASAGTVLFAGAGGGLSCFTANTIILSSSELSGGGPISVSGGCKLTVNGDLNAASVSVSGSGTVYTQIGHLLVASTIDVTSSGSLVMGGDAILNRGYTVAAASINIGAGATINANGMGYSAGASGAGAPTGSATYGAGGGNGGRGASSLTGAIATGGAKYGSVYQPTTWGFAGSTSAAYGGVGGKGGGAITFVVPGTFTINGTLSANGAAGAATGGGGGAGGSLWLTVGTIDGTGTVTANGANGNGTNAGGGGGGYIYVFYSGSKILTESNCTVARGTGGNTGAAISTVGEILFTTYAQTATKLTFLTQPSSQVRKNSVLPAQPSIVSQDASNNIVASFTGPVTLTAFTDAACSTPAGGSLTQAVTAVNGVLLYSGVKYDSVGVIYMKATSGGLTSACSSQVIVGGEKATQLVFTTQPSSPATAGVNFSTQPVVTAQDAGGNTDILAGQSYLSAFSDAACTVPLAGGTLSGSGSASLGVTTYSGVNYTKAGTLYLKASQTLEGANLSGCSSAVVVNPAAASQLVFTDGPSGNVQATVVFSPTPSLEVQDAYGNLISSSSASITIGAFTNAGCSTAASGTLSGAGTFAATNGLLDVPNLSYDTVTSNLRICAKASGLATDSFTINIVAGPLAKLVFQVNPAATGVTNVNLRSPQAIVRGTDSGGNQVAFINTPTVKFYTDAGCTTLATPDPVYAGGTTGSGSARVYTFTSLRFRNAGTYYVGASYGALTMACSSAVALINNVPVFFRNY